MRIKPVIDNEVFPYLIVDDLYNLDEQELIWNELDKHQDDLEVDIKAEDLLKNRKENVGNPTRLYMDELYKDKRNESAILSMYTDKVFSDEIIQAYSETTPAWVTYPTTNHDWTQISYHEKNDTYRKHFDSVMHTCVVWFYREPKRFIGGDLRFPQSNKVVEFKHNRMVLFPGYYLHEVDEVKMEKKDMKKGLGRYCITHFFSKK